MLAPPNRCRCRRGRPACCLRHPDPARVPQHIGQGPVLTPNRAKGPGTDRPEVVQHAAGGTRTQPERRSKSGRVLCFTPNRAEGPSKAGRALCFTPNKAKVHALGSSDPRSVGQARGPRPGRSSGIDMDRPPDPGRTPYPLANSGVSPTKPYSGATPVRRSRVVHCRRGQAPLEQLNPLRANKCDRAP